MFQMTKTSTLSLMKDSWPIISSFRKMSSAQDDVIFQDTEDKGVIILNRPKALNALDLSMVKKINPRLKEWESKKKLVLVKGAGGKAFCAGGDVRAVIDARRRGDQTLGRDFFKLEYETNGLIGSYKIPYIAFIDGIVMGGGVGLSVHGHYRIATERTLFAMPETQIGFFPDVGGSFFLPRLRGKLGWYLALTGQRLKGSDVLKAGIATHFCESKNLADLEQALMNCKNQGDIQDTLSKFEQKEVPEFSLEPVLAKIDKCFSSATMEEIVSNLEKDSSSWAKEALGLLNKMSPTSMKVTLRQLEQGRIMNLNDCLDMEYTMCQNFLKHKDFVEGVRALLIDKDQQPKWDPPTLSEVSIDFVNGHFVKESQETIKNRL